MNTTKKLQKNGKVLELEFEKESVGSESEEEPEDESNGNQESDFEEEKTPRKRKAEAAGNEKKGKRTRTNKNIPESTKVLTKWVEKHKDNPYPTKAQKEKLARRTCLNLKQVDKWFRNHRERAGLATPGRRGGMYPPEVIAVLRKWQEKNNSNNPYKEDKLKMSKKTGLSMEQIKNWFAHARARNKGAN